MPFQFAEMLMNQRFIKNLLLYGLQ